MSEQGVPGVFEATPQNFQTDVIERSRQVPIVVLFWADQVAPSAQARAMLEQLTGRFQGKVLLALVDVARDQSLAQHLRVQGLPSVRVVKDGQLIEQLEGPQTEEAYTALLEALTMSSSEMLKDQLDQLLESGNFDAALQALQAAITEEPHNQSFRVELADVLVRQGALDDAREVLSGIPDDTEDRERPANRLGLWEEAAGLEDRAVVEAAVAADADDLEHVYQLAVHDAVAERYEPALEHAMSILQRNREFREDIGRTTMIRIFSILGKGSELAQQYRRRMFNFMH